MSTVILKYKKIKGHSLGGKKGIWGVKFITVSVILKHAPTCQ